MPLRQTHTFVELELSSEAFNEIKQKLTDAGYQHAFINDNLIDMHGIAVKFDLDSFSKFVNAARNAREE